MREILKKMIEDVRKDNADLIAGLPNKAVNDAQRALEKKHGTPRSFAQAVVNAIGEISCLEAHTAIQRYLSRWNAAASLVLALSLVSCAEIPTPDGPIRTWGGKVAYHRKPNGEVKVVTDHDAAFAVGANTVSNVGMAAIAGNVATTVQHSQDALKASQDANAARIARDQIAAKKAVDLQNAANAAPIVVPTGTTVIK